MGRKLLTLIITCSGCFYRNTLPPCTNNISFRICAISKHCFKVQRTTSLQAFSEACASSSSSTWNVFVFVVLKQQKEAARKTAVPGESVTFGQSATFALIRKMDVGITTAHGGTEIARGSALLCRLQLLGTTEHGGSAPLWLHICSPTANTLNVKQTQHAPAEAFRGVCFPASCSFCSGYWVVTENCLISTIFFYSILGEKHISSKKFSWKPKLALLKERLDLGSCLPCLKQTLVTELLAISKTDALLYLCFPRHTHTY